MVPPFGLQKGSFKSTDLLLQENRLVYLLVLVLPRWLGETMVKWSKILCRITSAVSSESLYLAGGMMMLQQLAIITNYINYYHADARLAKTVIHLFF